MAVIGKINGINIELPTGLYVESVSGVVNRTTITGTAVDPIVDIAATYVGQTSITTLGTITTGTWNGTAISGTYIDESTVDHDQLLNFNANEHFTEASIDHTNILNIGSNTHAQIDTHIADATIHYTQASITTVGTITTGVWNGTAITNAYIDTGIADNKIVEIDSATVASGEYAKFTTVGLESRTFAEVKTDLSLDNVENTALSTWAGSANLTTLGTITSGTWNGTVIASAYLDADTAHLGVIQTFTAKHSFTSTAGGDAGINVGSSATAPTTNLANGDIYYDSGSNILYGRINGAWVDLGAAGSGISNVVEDTTPQLGGNLDVQANVINTSTVNGDISIQPNGTGDVILGNYTFDGNQTVGAGEDNYVLTYDNVTGLISLEASAGGGGGGGFTVTTQTGASYTAANGDFVLIDAATHTVTLPAPSADDYIGVKMINATVTDIQVKTQTGDNIDGTDYSTNGLQIYNQYDSLIFISDGTDWFITA